ncbi:hypothetical protein DFH28DRAFT_1089667 [Melampsora americana]|nr:hypothetical protein DFH28DRAFT_1089667 [Melampsora americana]
MTHNLSPTGRREGERLKEYLRSRESKKKMRRIIKLIQDKRRDEFCLLHEALSQVYHYTGPYLQKPGEKGAAANLLQFVRDFDCKTKWQWLQLRVDSL